VQPSNALTTEYHVMLMRPEWKKQLNGLVVYPDGMPLESLPPKFENLRASFLTVAQEEGYDSPDFRAQLSTLLDPYCAGVLA
jgi:hypothetical protein